MFSHGSALPAVLVVFATGSGLMNRFLADLVPPEVACRIGKRGGWVPAPPGIFGGNLSQCCHDLLDLEPQLKARLTGLATPFYSLAPSTHSA